MITLSFVVVMMVILHQTLNLKCVSEVENIQNCLVCIQSWISDHFQLGPPDLWKLLQTQECLLLLDLQDRGLVPVLIIGETSVNSDLLHQNLRLRLLFMILFHLALIAVTQF